MGKALSPLVADYYMASLEQRLFNHRQPPPLYCRYVDDCLLVWDPAHGQLDDFLAEYNQQHPNIQLTVEHEQHGKLPYLDLTLTKTTRHDGVHLQVAVYRKPGNSGRFITSGSYHHPTHKRAAWNSLCRRAITHPTTHMARAAELRYIHQLAAHNGYSATMIQTVYTQQQAMIRGHRTGRRQQEPQVRISMPYTTTLFPGLRRLGAHFGLEFVPRTQDTLASSLTNFKHNLPLAQTSGVVYSIPCSCGHRYIGETGRELATRVHEHQHAWTTRAASSAFGGEHFNHQPNFDNATVLAASTKPAHRQIQEAFLISRAGHSAIPNNNIRIAGTPVNNNAGLLLDACWRELLPRIYLKEEK